LILSKSVFFKTICNPYFELIKGQPMAEKINRLKTVLTELGMTQKELAEKLGVTEHTISRICTNDTQPSLKRLRQIALLLEVDIRDLIVPTIAKHKF
jgi:transcriptional regulator with XRE-family HTH domain